MESKPADERGFRGFFFPAVFFFVVGQHQRMRACIQRVQGKGDSVMGKVDANLMGSAGERLDGQQGKRT